MGSTACNSEAGGKAAHGKHIATTHPSELHLTAPPPLLALRALQSTKQPFDNEIQTMIEQLSMNNTTIDKGFIQTWDTQDSLPRVIYYTRKDPGTPKVSPKAGNMNAAIFAIDYPDQAPVIGDSTIVVVDDCRYELT